MLRILIFGTTFEADAERAELTDLWVKLHRALNPDCDLLLVDSASPYRPGIAQRHPDIPLLSFADNIGHLNGWGRAFCKGLHHAIVGDYDWVVHIEGDSLCREPIRPAVEKFAADGIRVIAPPFSPGWIETGFMFFGVGWLVGHEFIERYDWEKRSPSAHPEEVIHELVGSDLYLLPWAVLRDDASKLTTDNVGNYFWISHTAMDNLRRFAELGAQPTRLHFGCGSNRLPGWANYDAEVDIAKTLPFPDNSAEAIFCEHVLEHVPLRAAQDFLRECYRVLKPSGRLRVAVPSIEQIEQQADVEYITFCSQWARLDLKGTLRGALDSIINAHGHQMIWTAASLQAVIYWAGFEWTRRCPPGQSHYPDFQNLEGHGKVIGERFNRIETVVVEAAKPV
jgi:SAM-dependent methyltransferase